MLLSSIKPETCVALAALFALVAFSNAQESCYAIKGEEPTCDLSLLVAAAPDPFGYEFIDSSEPGGPTFSWVDIASTGVPVLLSDDDTDGPFPVGFDFPLYGDSFSQLWVSSNGWINFVSPTASDPVNDCPITALSAGAQPYRIDLMHDDLDPGNTSDILYYQSFAASPHPDFVGRCLVVTYDSFKHWDGASGVVAGTFQALIFESGDILVQFLDAGDEEGSGSTTGIINGDRTIGLTYACNSAGSLIDNLAVRFFRDDPQERVLFSMGVSYSMGPDAPPQLYRINPTNGRTISSIPITLPGEGVFDGAGLATHPQTGELWALLELADSASMELVVLDPLTGLASSVGSTGDRFTSLDFDFEGTLYSVSNAYATNVTPEALFTLSTVDATPTHVLGGISTSDVIHRMAYDPDDRLMYHTSGAGVPNVDQLLESIALPAGPITNIPLGGAAYSGVRSMTYRGDGVFLIADGSIPPGLFTLDTSGTATSIDTLDHISLGLAFAPLAQPRLHSISPDDDLLRQINPVTGETMANVGLIFPGEMVLGGAGLATDPLTGQMWALLSLDGQTGSELVTVEPGSGVVNSIGDTGDIFAGLAFGADGTLYGVTDDTATVPETLFTLDQITAAPTPFMPLGNGGDGEAIAFNPLNGLIHHASGRGLPNTDEVFESIELSGPSVAPIALTGDDYDELLALTYRAGNGFLGADRGPSLLSLNANGNVANLASMDHVATGLAHTSLAPPAMPPAICPAAGTLYGATHNGPDGPSRLWIIDPRSGSAQFVGDIGFERVTGLDFSADGTLYGIAERSDGSNINVLITIDPCTGNGTEIGPTGIEGLGFSETPDISFRPSDGTLFTFLDLNAVNALGTIEVQTGAATLVGLTVEPVIGLGNGIAFNTDDRLYHANELFINTLDQTTGNAVSPESLIWLPPADNAPRINGMDFQPGIGALFGSLDDGNSENHLAVVNPIDGSVRIIGPTVNNLDAIAFVPHTDLEIFISDSVDPVSPGDPLTYTLTLRNSGPATAINTEVIDNLPAGVSYQSHTASRGTFTPGTGVWHVGDLSAPPAVMNGGFESGDFSGWTPVTTADPGTNEFLPFRVTTAGMGAEGFFYSVPAEGELFLQNGFDGGAGLMYDLHQEIEFPADVTRAELTWAERIQWDLLNFSPPLISSREYEVTVQPVGGGAPLATLFEMELPPYTIGDTGYVFHTEDLLAAVPGLPGQTVRINWHEFIPDSSSGPAQFDLDAVNLLVEMDSTTATLVIDLTVDQWMSGTITNVATATSSLAEFDVSNNTALEETLVLAPEIGVDPLALSFPQTSVTGPPTGPQQIIIENTGTLPLNFSGNGIEITGPQAGSFLDNSPPTTPLAPGASREVVITFDPITAGPQSAELTITTDDVDEASVAVQLTGSVEVTIADLVAALLGVIPSTPLSEFDINTDTVFDTADVVTEINNP